MNKQTTPRKTIVITGGTDGIGKATAMQLARTGAKIILVGRTEAKGQQAMQEITAATGNHDVVFLAADLTLMADTERLAQDIAGRHAQVDILVHSAGVMLNEKQMTSEGLEAVMAVQYLSRYLLTERLLPQVQAGGGGRVLTVAGGSRMVKPFNFGNFNAEQRFSGLTRLQDTGAANVLWTLDLSRREGDNGLSVYNYYPGLTKTDLGKSMPALFRLLIKAAMPIVALTPEQAAASIVALATGDYKSGFYDKKLRETMPPTDMTTVADQERLRRTSKAAITDAFRATQQIAGQPMAA